MNYDVWSLEGVRILPITTNRWEGPQLWVNGVSMYHERLVQWEATVLQNGWYVRVIADTGRIGEVQGATFNLPLEVAAAVRRLA